MVGLHAREQEHELLVVPRVVRYAAARVRADESQDRTDRVVVRLQVLHEARRPLGRHVAARQRLLDRCRSLAVDLLGQLRLEADRQRLDGLHRADAGAVDLPVIQDQEVVVVDRERAAVDVAVLHAAPGGADRECVRARAELGLARPSPEDAILAAPLRLEPALKLGSALGKVR
jgi:hypothetical protein